VSLIRSLLFIPIFYFGSMFTVLGSSLGAYVSRRMLLFCVQCWSRYHHFCAHYVLGIRTRIEGDFVIKPALYAIKHESMFETIDMPRMFGEPAVVAKQELFRIPFWGHAATSYGLIAVDREAGSGALRKMIGWGKEMQAKGRPIVIFPEGTRVPHGQCPPLQSGFAGLYKLLGLPVIPIAVDSGRLIPRGSIIRHSGFITYRIGAEIPPGLPREEIEARVHAAINALNNQSALPAN
jgi:1-acyl-sn-glycerol-3-phosphate acyltransferase